MTNPEKLNRVTTQLQTRQGISRAFPIGLAALALPLIISSCATEAQFLAQNAP